MPEGHLLHRYARLHRKHLVGRPVAASSPQGRFTSGAERIDGRVLDDAEAYGKHLFHRFDDAVVHVHLGRQGTLLWLPSPPPAPRASVRLRMGAEAGAADLIAPLVCELGDDALRDEVVEGLGPDPLRDDADPEIAWAAIHASRRPIGALLLDQSVVAGIGNVLRAELLNMAGIHPSLEGSMLPRRTFDDLWTAIRGVMRVAAEEGRIITRRPAGVPAADIDEIEGRFVYKRERCGRCGSPLERLEIADRAINACPVCQPR
jgi:endonuclease VIII